jgi:hypothetical protein
LSRLPLLGIGLFSTHWIEVKDNRWKLRSEVVGFQPVSGDHSGWNLGQYFVGLCDRMGIFNENGSKASPNEFVLIFTQYFNQQPKIPMMRSTINWLSCG